MSRLPFRSGWKRVRRRVLAGTGIVRLLLLALAIVPFVFLASYTYYKSYDSLTRSVIERRELTAHLAAATLREKFERLTDVGLSLASRRQFRRLAERGEWDEAMAIIADGVAHFPYIDRAFLADLSGTETAAFPELTGGVGKNFANREWYRGVSRDWKPYISGIYSRRAEPPVPIVALAVPVKNDAGAVIAILVFQVRAETLSSWSRELHVGKTGFVYFVDRRGRIAGHPSFAGARRTVDFSGFGPVNDLTRGVTGSREAADPATGARIFTTYTTVAPYGWGAVVSQPVGEAFAERDQSLRASLGVFVLLFLLNCVFAIAVWRAEAALIDKEKEIAGLSAEREQLDLFAFVVSHDLQEPLQKMVGFGTLMKERYGDRLDGEGRHYLDRVDSSARRLMAMLEDLRRFSRVRRTGAFADVDLGKIVRQAAQELDPAYASAGAEVEIGPLPRIQGDPHQLAQLFKHLFDNALKFRKPDVPLRVRVASRAGIRGFCEVTVSDNGQGFDQRYLDLIFVPFKKLHSKDEYEGSGIGLAICRKVALLHGGNITADSVPGKGTDFVVAFPLQAPPGR